MSDRGFQFSDWGKGKRRAELLELCPNAAEMKQQKLLIGGVFRSGVGRVATDKKEITSKSRYIAFLVS